MNYSNPQRYKNGDRIELQESSTLIIQQLLMLPFLVGKDQVFWHVLLNM